MSGTGSAVSGPPVRRGRGLVIIAAAVAVLIIAASAGYVVIRVRQHQEAAGLRESGLPASVSTSLANLMQLSPVPVTSAPGFTLTDQGGQAMSLASLRGRVVVLEFMDPHCTDICPIVSQEFTDAYRDLGASAPHVVFLAVNVNRYHLQVAAAIAAGLADAGIASEPAARAYDLAFIPLAAEHFDLVIPAGQFASREVQGRLKILSSAWLVDQLANLPGYDPARCGERIATLPQRHQPVPA